MIEYLCGRLHQEVIFAGEVTGVVLNSSQLLLAEESSGRFAVALETGLRLRAATPAKALIAAAEIDYADYRRAVERLWDEHPLFEERPIVRVAEPRSMHGVSRADFDNFVAQVEILSTMLQSIDPVSFLWVRERLWQAHQGAMDDGSAVWLLNTGYQFLQILREPFRVQAYLRNILEVAFDGTERASQQERFEKLRRTYPDIATACDPASLDNTPEGQRVFAAHDLFGLYLLELALYFRQEGQRIARCDYCWHYFIPKTKKATRYCDRVTDGQSCKQWGANLARLETAAQDEALLICKKLRDRMYARLLRWQDAPPTERGKLIPMDYGQYEAWSENARLARMEYLRGELTTEEFLRKIDTTHELQSYEVGKAEPADGPTLWQRRVASDITFDPAESLPEEFMVLDRTHPGDQDAQWELHTADDLRRYMQKGHQSLREKYSRDK